MLCYTLFSFSYSTLRYKKRQYFFLFHCCCCWWLKASNSNWSHADLSIRYGFHRPINVRCATVFSSFHLVCLCARIEIIIDYAQRCLLMTTQTKIDFIFFVFLFIEKEREKKWNPTKQATNRKKQVATAVNNFCFALMLASFVRRYS